MKCCKVNFMKKEGFHFNFSTFIFLDVLIRTCKFDPLNWKGVVTAIIVANHNELLRERERSFKGLKTTFKVSIYKISQLMSQPNLNRSCFFAI